MGKYIGYIALIMGVLFVLEWLQIVDVPYLEIPDYFSGKAEMANASSDVLDQMK